jgi:phenylpropionate dioxygenase-like ring-hydroxylating dioxygenase large terminal subunit
VREAIGEARGKEGNGMPSNETDLLEHTWLPIARAEDVRVDRPFGAELLGRRLVVFRDSAGVSVAADRCPHRGGRLSDGRMVDGALQCPYHGWRWNGEGRCVLVPSQPSAHPSAKLESLPAEERYGLVWTTLGEPLLELPAIPETTEVAAGWETVSGDPFDVRCGLRSITENFRDSSHFGFVHRETFADVDPEVPAYTVERQGWRLSWSIRLTFGPRWSVEGADGKRASKYRFGETNGQRSGDERMELHYRFEMPSLAYVLTEHEEGGRRLVCQVAAPLDATQGRCRVFWFVAANEAFRRRFGTLDTQVAIEARVFSEDVSIVEALDPIEAPLDLDGQAHVRADRYSVAYRRLYGELLDAFAEGRDRGAPPDAKLAGTNTATDPV